MFMYGVISCRPPRDSNAIHWLAAAGLTQTRLEVSGAFAFFEATA